MAWAIQRLDCSAAIKDQEFSMSEFHFKWSTRKFERIRLLDCPTLDLDLYLDLTNCNS